MLLVVFLHCSKAIKAWIADHSVKEAVVVGGGFIGMEMVENLTHLGVKVTLVELLTQVREPPQPGGLVRWTAAKRSIPSLATSLR